MAVVSAYVCKKQQGVKSDGRGSALGREGENRWTEESPQVNVGQCSARDEKQEVGAFCSLPGPCSLLRTTQSSHTCSEYPSTCQTWAEQKSISGGNKELVVSH